jgi:hypothetical protein
MDWKVKWRGLIVRSQVLTKQSVGEYGFGLWWNTQVRRCKSSITQSIVCWEWQSTPRTLAAVLPRQPGWEIRVSHDIPCRNRCSEPHTKVIFWLTLSCASRREANKWNILWQRARFTVPEQRTQYKVEVSTIMWVTIKMKNVLTPSLHGAGVHICNVIPCIVGIFYSLYDPTDK